MSFTPSSEKIHIYTGNISIRWRDVDPFMIVNHAIIFTLMEEIRLKWFKSTGLENSLKYFYPIVDAHATFQDQIKYPANLQINLFTSEIKEKSWIFYHEVFNENNLKKICAKASIISVVYDQKLKSAIPIPVELRDVLCNPLNSIENHHERI